MGRARLTTSQEFHLPRPKCIYMFRRGDSGLYAYTTDLAGRPFPSQLYGQMSWHYVRRVALRLPKDSADQLVTKEALDAIAKQGFYLMHAAIHAELRLYAAWKSRTPCTMRLANGIAADFPNRCR
jgi:hypothetical protein